MSPAFRFRPGEFVLHGAVDLEFLYVTILSQNPPDSFSFSFSFFLVALGLRGSPRTFSGCGEPGPLLAAVHGLLTVLASRLGEHRL